jgi:hypothetical protein
MGAPSVELLKAVASEQYIADPAATGKGAADILKTAPGFLGCELLVTCWFCEVVTVAL